MKRKYKIKCFLQFSILIMLYGFIQEKYFPDTNINGVELIDGISFEKKFKQYKLPEYYEADHPPKLEFINSDKTQKFTVFHCYGSGKNDICTFRVEFQKKSDTISFYGVQIADKNFKTGKGIQLGMTLENFKKKIGTKKFKVEMKNRETKITIELDYTSNESFLKFYNMPNYLGEYYFKNDRLIAFEFGFPTP